MYADDTVLLTESPSALQSVLNTFKIGDAKKKSVNLMDKHDSL